MELGYPNSKKGYRCNLNCEINYGWDLPDWYRNIKHIESLEDLHNHYVLFTTQQREKFYKDFPNARRVKRDDYLDFLINRRIGICPQGIVSENSKYWLELIGYCDGEMGMSLPGNMEELPDLFFQALRIVRGVKSDIRKEESSGPKKNRDNN